MANYLVTGAAGFIGAAVARNLIQDQHRVVTIDNLSTGFRENVPEGVELYEADVQDAEVYKLIPQEKYDAIFHIAGQSSGEISFDNPVYDLRTNTESTLQILKFALRSGCNRVIYASSMSVYGVKPDRPVSESESLCPLSFYGVGKLASEHYLRIYEQYGIHTTSLRLFNVYGPGQNMENLRQGMVSIYLAQILKDKKIQVKGSRERYRDFVYIDDVVEAFRRCLISEKSFGTVINIATGVRTTVKDLLALILELFGEHIAIEYKEGTVGDMHGIYADTHLMKEILGWECRVPLRIGLERMIRWAQNSTP